MVEVAGGEGPSEDDDDVGVDGAGEGDDDLDGDDHGNVDNVVDVDVERRNIGCRSDWVVL